MVCNSGLVFGSGDGIYRLVKNCKVISFPEVKLPRFPEGIGLKMQTEGKEWQDGAGGLRDRTADGGCLSNGGGRFL